MQVTDTFTGEQKPFRVQTGYATADRDRRVIIVLGRSSANLPPPPVAEICASSAFFPSILHSSRAVNRTPHIPLTGQWPPRGPRGHLDLSVQERSPEVNLGEGHFLFNSIPVPTVLKELLGWKGGTRQEVGCTQPLLLLTRSLLSPRTNIQLKLRKSPTGISRLPPDFRRSDMTYSVCLSYWVMDRLSLATVPSPLPGALNPKPSAAES